MPNSDLAAIGGSAKPVMRGDVEVFDVFVEVLVEVFAGVLVAFWVT
jgi:hypothetical protein